MAAAALTRSIAPTTPDPEHRVFFIALQVLTVAAALALCLAFAKGLWMVRPGQVIVCNDAPELCK